MPTKKMPKILFSSDHAIFWEKKQQQKTQVTTSLGEQ